MESDAGLPQSIAFDSPILLLTGAGASVPAKIPGMAGFAEQFEKGLAKNSPDYAVFQRLVRIAGRRDLEDVLHLANQLCRLEEEPVTPLIEGCVAPKGSKVKALKKYRQRLHDLSREVYGLRERLLSYISARCFGFDRTEALALYQPLVESLASKSIPIFTTNYDPLIEHVGARIGVAVHDNFRPQGRPTRFFWDDELSSFAPGEGLPLVKLHGSVTWYANGEGRIERLRDEVTRNQDGEPVKQLLIFPTRFKDIYEKTYFPLYMLFTRSLAQASLLVVIGHSLRDEYIAAAIREELRQRQLRVVVIDPQLPRMAKTLREETSKDAVVHLRGSVANYASALSGAVGLETPADALAALIETSDIRRRYSRPSISLGKLPNYVQPGSTLTSEVTIVTRSGNYVPEVSLQLASDGSEVPVNVDGLPGRVTGLGMEVYRLTIELSDDLARGKRYFLKARLRPEGGSRGVTDLKGLKVYKNPASSL